jgi:S-adenosyl-L-methionine hydrolase (adenosine-forming)
VPPPPRGRRRPPRLVTLSSDLGWAYAAQMKGVLLRAHPEGGVVDLTHDLPRHRITESAFVLRAMATPFPAGTIHVAVVDPGVGGRRASLAIRCRDGSVLVGPDNGVLSPLATALGRPVAYRLNPLRVQAKSRVGTTFDGRDIFAPAAARIAGGETLARLGTRAPFESLRMPEVRNPPDGAEGEVVHVDHFGNLISNVPTAWVPAGTRHLSVSIGGRQARLLPWVASYEELRRGQLGTLGSSFGTVEVAVAEGSAAERVGGRAGTTLGLGLHRSGGSVTERVNSRRNLRKRPP